MSALSLAVMVLVCGFVWGGFAVLLARAVRREAAKGRVATGSGATGSEGTGGAGGTGGEVSGRPEARR